MPKSSKLKALKNKIASVPLPVRRPSIHDPRVTARLVIGILLAANIAAALFVYRPWADSPKELAQQLAGTRLKQIQERNQIEKLKVLVKKSELARKEGETFLNSYFLGRRIAASTLATELTTMAKSSGVKPKEHSFGIEPIEGSDTLLMMNITANYEGTYADLVNYINKLDRSPRFFIVESLAAAPQQGGLGVLNIALKINVFVREDDGLPLLTKAEPAAQDAAEEEEVEAPKLVPPPKPAPAAKKAAPPATVPPAPAPKGASK